MSEEALYHGEKIKIGTCEDMYYLRADQAHLVTAMLKNYDPVRDAEKIRFRFPFPQEDNIPPGGFSDPFYGLGVYGVEVPDDVEHGMIQFRADKGLLVSLPCPYSPEGKAAPYHVAFNGFGGPVKIVQQRLFRGQLVLVCQCGCCGRAYRYPVLADAESLVNALIAKAQDEPLAGGIGSASYYLEVARRIIDGYLKPNHWTAKNNP
jgi:hypothetical protein